MAVKFKVERRSDLLVLGLRGSIGFAEEDFQMKDDLIALLREQIDSGVRYLLIDFSETSFVFPSSYELGVLPFLQKEVVGESRIAACFKKNRKVRDMLHIMRLDRAIDCFDTEAEALHFLQSDTSPTKL